MMWNARVNAISTRVPGTGFTARIVPMAPLTCTSFRQNGAAVVTHAG